MLSPPHQAIAPMKAKRLNTMKASLGYGEFLKFASDFDLSSSVILRCDRWLV